MGFLSKLFGKEDAVSVDARRVYAKLMVQSRNTAFYTKAGFADDYDGRIDVLTLHIAAILSNLNRFGVNGERLGQAIFDEMKDDFEIALREEALSDASVKKRIQPMISLFYDRVKKYAEALNQDAPQAALSEAFIETLMRDGGSEDRKNFVSQIVAYLFDFDRRLLSLSLGEIALTDFEFPAINE